MAHGTPRGKVDAAFSARVESLETRARAQSESFRTLGTPRPWHTPDGMKIQNLLDVPNLHEPAWNRDKLNQNYSYVMSAEGYGTHGDLVAIKKQIDFMAAEERAWRLRHASCVRCNTLANGRLNGHGMANGSIFSMLKKSVENDLLAGIGGASPFVGDVNTGGNPIV